MKERSSDHVAGRSPPVCGGDGGILRAAEGGSRC